MALLMLAGSGDEASRGRGARRGGMKSISLKSSRLEEPLPEPSGSRAHGQGGREQAAPLAGRRASSQGTLVSLVQRTLRCCVPSPHVTEHCRGDQSEGPGGAPATARCQRRRPSWPPLAPSASRPWLVVVACQGTVILRLWGQRLDRDSPRLPWPCCWQQGLPEDCLQLPEAQGCWGGWELGVALSHPDAHLRPVPHSPGGRTGHILIARGFGRRLGQVCTGRWLQGALLIQPHTADAEHRAAGQAPWPAGAGARLPLPCPPPAGHTGLVSQGWLDAQALRLQAGPGPSPGDDSPEP